MSNPTGNPYIAAAQAAIAKAKKAASEQPDSGPTVDSVSEQPTPGSTGIIPVQVQTGSVLTDYKWPIIAGIILMIFLLILHWYTGTTSSKTGFKMGNAFGIVGEL